MTDDSRTCRVLVVEDSPVARRLLVDILGSDPELRVVAEAANGGDAVRAATRYRPDVIVMDVVMPTMGGFEATRRIMELVPTPIVLVSAIYHPGDLSKSLEALEAGALTLLAKPTGPDADNFAATTAVLTATVKLMADVKVTGRRAVGATGHRLGSTSPPDSVGDRSRPVQIVAMAASTGGPAALSTILSALPRDTPVPIVVVQHNTAGFDQILVDWLASTSKASVRLARNGDLLQAGEILIGPAGAHLGVTRSGRVALSNDPPVGSHRPSATYMFRSVARAYGAAALGVILTGIGDDGVAGLADLKEAGGMVLAQDEATSTVYGMPGMAASLGVVDWMMPLDQIAGALMAAWNGAKR